MPELRYRDNQNIYALPRMGQSFSDAVIGLNQLKLKQLEMQREDMYRNAQMGMEMRRLDIEQPLREAETEQYKSKADEQKELLKAARSFSDSVKNMYDPMKQGVVGPPSQQQMDQQNAAAALAFIMATSPAAAARRMEPQQFAPGPVYSPFAGMAPGGQAPQPMFNAPPAPPSDFQRMQLGERMREASTRAFQQKQLYAIRLMQELERRRHNKAQEAAKGGGVDAAEFAKRLGGGTSAPAGRFTIKPYNPTEE